MSLRLAVAAVYIVISLIAGYMYMETTRTIDSLLEPLSCDGRTYKINPEGVILEYSADIRLISGGDSRAHVVYQVSVTGSPCEGGIPVYTPIKRVEGNQSLSTLLLNTGLLYPHTLTMPGALDPRQFIYIIPEESLLALRIQGEHVSFGAAPDSALWNTLTYASTSQQGVGGSTIKSFTGLSINPDTGILSRLTITSSLGNQSAVIDLRLEKVYIPVKGQGYIELNRAYTSITIPAFISGFAAALAVYTLARRD